MWSGRELVLGWEAGSVVVEVSGGFQIARLVGPRDVRSLDKRRSFGFYDSILLSARSKHSNKQLDLIRVGASTPCMLCCSEWAWIQRAPFQPF